MITLIILIVLVGIGIYLTTIDWSYGYLGYELLGMLMTAIFGIWLVGHVICISTVSYSYEMFLVKRTAFELTLNNARESGNKYETATIVKDVSEWNINLAKVKYNNKTIWFDQFIDDRVEDLKPIK